MQRTVGLSLSFMACMFLFSGLAHADLLLWYDFNNASRPDTALDGSGNGNDGEVFDAEYTEAGLGRTGGGDDRALDFLGDQDGVYVDVPSAEAGAFDSIVDNDRATVTLWVFGGEFQPQNNFAFWFADGDVDPRQLSATIPWSDGQIYFDVAGCCDAAMQRINERIDEETYRDQWNHYAFVKDEELSAVYQNGELLFDSDAQGPRNPLETITTVRFGSGQAPGQWSYNGLMDEIGVWDEALTEARIVEIMTNGLSTAVKLRAGDADQDLDFDQLDLVRVQVAGKYLSGQVATWGEGDWDAAPGGEVGSPPIGDGQFNQLDIISALSAGVYLTGPYAAVAATPAVEGDGQTSVIYNAATGEVAVDAPAGTELTSINIDSAASIFTGNEAQNLGGSFDNNADNNIFKATFGSSFGPISFGSVAPPNLEKNFLLNDLTVVGSLAGGGALGNVDLVYVPVPEPTSIGLLFVGLAFAIMPGRNTKRDDSHRSVINRDGGKASPPAWIHLLPRSECGRIPLGSTAF